MASVYSIRSAAETDIDTLVDFTLREAAEAERVTLSVDGATAGVRGAFATPPLSTYWVAVDATDSIAASTSVVKEWSNFHGGYYWWVQSLYILPDHRRSGLVDQLIDHLAMVSRSAGALDLRLYVHRSNRRALRAYSRCGFAEAPYSIMTLTSTGSGPDDHHLRSVYQVADAAEAALMAVDIGRVVIRPCRLTECQAVLELWLAYHPPGIPAQLDQIQRLVGEYGDHVLVATADDVIVGTVIAGWDGWRGHLHHLTVRPDYRRRGVARELVAEAERRLRLKGAPRVSVLAERQNADANAFYESLRNVGYMLDTWMQRYTKGLQ